MATIYIVCEKKAGCKMECIGLIPSHLLKQNKNLTLGIRDRRWYYRGLLLYSHLYIALIYYNKHL